MEPEDVEQESLLRAVERKADVVRALRELPSFLLLCVVLRFGFEFSVKEISTVLGCGQQKVTEALAQAMEILRRRLE